MKFKEVQKLSEKDKEKKIKELKMELIKSKSSSTKTGSTKNKEIRKIIARILTSNKTGVGTQ
ncbi:50S ribosomal protein L29 [archaeon]|jgi:ribosomal protein L29|nr:50S ribosomal protein L29 [archaeon]MBT4373164.1 50S ribosomal protein L29 [archaeon]MBT4531509.1 50S ribosomal protein L29 [archaeon]MBT7001313.1 50S ribosomal protein L29 [archaeon]MBT7282201.1 50S ribosomal protein L29 [archaeon]